jgi:hypothetical protein
MAWRYHVATVRIPRGHKLAVRTPHRLARVLEWKYDSMHEMFICTVIVEEEVPDDLPVHEPDFLPEHEQASAATAGSTEQ